jgi:hypothetical protein
MSGKWSKEAGAEYLRLMKQSCLEGAYFVAAEGLVRRVQDRKVVAAKNQAEAEEVLKASGWTPWEHGYMCRAPSGAPHGKYLEHLEHKFKYLAGPRPSGGYGGERSRGALTIRELGTHGLGERHVFVGPFQADWGRRFLEGKGWIPAVCPIHVNELDVAWYPPEAK